MNPRKVTIRNLEEYRTTPFIWPEGYAILAVMNDGEYMCHHCTTTESEVHEGGDADNWRVEDYEIYWEGPEVPCAHCGKLITAEYGDPDF